MSPPERPHKPAPHFADTKTARSVKERARNALITGTAGGYLGGMMIEGKARVKIPGLTRKLLGIKRRTVGIHGARSGALIGALAGAANKGKRSETADAVATGGDWKFSAYVEDMKFSGLPKDVQDDVTRFVDAKKDTPVVHYGMTVKELLTKADPLNLQTARKHLGTLRASRAADEVLKKTKDGSKYVLLMNDRVIDGHHFLAKAERGKVTSSLNVLDLTPARLMTKLSAQSPALTQFDGQGPTRKQSAAMGAAVPLAAGGLVIGTRGGRNVLRSVLKRMDKSDPRRVRLASLVQKRKDASIARNSGKAVAQARDKFRAEAPPKAPKEPTLGDAVQTVKKRVKKRVVQAVSNIGANPSEVQMGALFFGKGMKEQGNTGGRKLTRFAERTRTQKLRDQVGLAKDAAGLGLTAGVGVGAHKLYKQGKVMIRRVGLRIAATAKAWHGAALKAGGTLDVVKDAVSPVATTNRGIASAGRKIVKGLKKATMWMHGDPRRPVSFEAPAKRDKLSQARDVAVIGAGVAGGVLAHKVGDNLRNATRVSADVGRVYGNLTEDVRDPKRYVAKVKNAYRGGVAEGKAGAVKPWARRVVRAGKALRMLEAKGARTLLSAEIPADTPYGVIDHKTGGLMHRTTYAKRQVSRSVASKLDLKYGAARYKAGILSGKHLTAAVLRAKKGVHFSQFGAGAALVLSGVGTLIGSQAGSRLRYGVQNRVRKSLTPKIGKKWARRVGRVAGFAPENVGAIAGGVGGSMIGGGISRQRVEMSAHEFGGREQLKDVDSSGFLDPLDVFVGRKKGYTAQQVKDYHRHKNYVTDVQSGKRKGSGTAVQSAQDAMKSIRGAPAQASHGQVFRSLLKKGDSVRRVSERGGGLAKDAVAHLRGDAREKDASGRVKKREWEKPWFQRTKNQVAAAAALGGGYALLKGRPKLRAKVDRGVRAVQRKVNSVVPDLFPGVKPLRQPGQKTVASVNAKAQAAAQAKVQKTQATVAQAATNIAAAAKQVRKNGGTQKGGTKNGKWAGTGGGGTPYVPPAAPKPKAPKKFAAIGGRIVQFDDPYATGWDVRDARGRSARVFAPGAGQRDRRPKAWHEKVENERKLWAGASLAGTLTGGLAARKLLQGQVKAKVKLATSGLEKKVARDRAVAKSQQARLKTQAEAGRKIVRPSFNTPPQQAA